jgi:translation elongation factor EF-Ts
MTNMEELIPFLSRRCKKRHFHTPLQGSNRTRAAQQHPKALCRDIVQGILTHLSKELNYILEAYVFEEDEEMEDVPQGPAEEGDALELPGEAPGESQT